MKNRFSLLLVTVLVSHLIMAQEHIVVSNPQTWSAQALVPYIGKTVIFDVPMVVTSNYGGLTISTRRLYTPTNQALPRSQEYNSIVSLNKAGEVTLNGVSDYHRCGEKIYNLKVHVNSASSVTWVSGEWRGNTRAELEAGIPDVGDYNLLVCTYNLENYFLYYSGHDKQRTKIIKAFTRINADIIGLVEVEEGNEGIKEIASYLNTTLPERAYKYCDNGGTSTYQTVAYIYDSKKVKPLGSIQYNNKRTQNRKKMLCFEELETGERFIFSVNHFKAKSGTGSGGNADLGDGQGSWNADRKEEAQSVVDNYRAWSKQIGETDILMMGDLNAYGKEDPITLLGSNGMIDLHRAFHADSSYSYQWSGRAGYLDHALCNSSMRPQITGMSAFHINSDESDNYTYDKSSDLTMFRSSDHDPVLVGLRLDGALTYDPTPKINTEDIIGGQTNRLTIRDAYKDGQKSFYAIYTTSGWQVERQEINNAYQSVEIPSEPGIYILYVYFDGQVYPHKFIVR
jgi:hypothetical protein